MSQKSKHFTSLVPIGGGLEIFFTWIDLFTVFRSFWNVVCAHKHFSEQSDRAYGILWFFCLAFQERSHILKLLRVLGCYPNVLCIVCDKCLALPEEFSAASWLSAEGHQTLLCHVDGQAPRLDVHSECINLRIKAFPINEVEGKAVGTQEQEPL